MITERQEANKEQRLSRCPHLIKSLVNDEIWYWCRLNDNRLCQVEYNNEICDELKGGE